MSEVVKQAAANTAAAGERRERKAPLWKKLLFSDVLLFRPISHKLAYIGVMAALCIAVNTFEIKFADTQFSFSLFTALLAGVMLGALPGAVAVFVGDLFGYLQQRGDVLLLVGGALSDAHGGHRRARNAHPHAF